MCRHKKIKITMKKVYTIVLSLFVVLSTTAQNIEIINFSQTEYKIIGNGSGVGYEKILESTGLSVQQAHDNIISFFAKSYGNSNVTNRIDLPNHILYKSTFHRIVNGFGCWMNSDYIIDIAIKDNRIRIQAYATTGSIEDNNHAPRTYFILDKYPVTTKVGNFYKGMLKKAFYNTMSALRDITISVENAVRHSSTTDDNW